MSSRQRTPPAKPRSSSLAPDGLPAAPSPPPRAVPGPRTPEMAPGPPGGWRGGARGGSATPPSDDALSLASGTTASFSSSADAALFAPASTEDAVHAVPSLLSQLLSGRTDEQVLAARKLLAYCRAAGRPVETAIAGAGGVHMLLIMLDSLDRSLRDVCTRLLTSLAADDAVRSEILGSPGGTAKVIQLMYRGILDGQASAGRFLELLAGSSSPAVQAALCHGKVVRMLCRTLQSAPTPQARCAALSALQAFCRQDPANLHKLVWSGGVEALLGVVQADDSPAASGGAALSLLGAVAALGGDAATALATPAAVAVLAPLVGAPDAPLQAQAEAAGVLAAAAAAPHQREGVQQALTDLLLPRVLEIVHEAAAEAEGEQEGQHEGQGGLTAAHSDGGGGGDAQRRLREAAAAVVAQLAARDAECCHALLLHARLLRATVDMLVAAGRYAAARELLQAAHSYAASLGGAAGGSVGAVGGTGPE